MPIHQEQEFAYQKEEDGICILRCYGVSSRVDIPGSLEGTPVIGIASYAFAKEMEQEPPHVGGLPCICGEDLEELYLPDTIKRLGRYVFYNCIHFRKLSFYSNISYIGAGAFTGCGQLSSLACYQKDGKSCLREILQDLKQYVSVGCYSIEGTDDKLAYRLAYPGFFEEAVENTPARIISTQTHGMGIQYRNAFRDTQVMLQEYDSLFETGKYNIEFPVLVDLAVSRLRYPYGLEEDAKARYSCWLREHMEEAAVLLLGQEDLTDLKWLAGEFAGSREELERMLHAAASREDTAALSQLMHTMHERFPVRKKEFVL